MAWRVLFVRDCDVHLCPQRHVAYRAGHIALLTDDQTAAAILSVELLEDRTPNKPCPPRIFATV